MKCWQWLVDMAYIKPQLFRGQGLVCFYIKRQSCFVSSLFLDVCNSTDLPEVEIISLLEEQLPHYKLRADTIYGYDHDDWLHTPLISPDANIDLTTEQIEETLKYFRKSKYVCLQSNA